MTLAFAVVGLLFVLGLIAAFTRVTWLGFVCVLFMGVAVGIFEINLGMEWLGILQIIFSLIGALLGYLVCGLYGELARTPRLRLSNRDILFAVFGILITLAWGFLIHKCLSDSEKLIPQEIQSSPVTLKLITESLLGENFLPVLLLIFLNAFTILGVVTFTQKKKEVDV